MNTPHTIQAQVRVGVGVLVIQSGKILLGKRKGSHAAGTWCAPGGHLEHLETVKDCAARELLEETGLIAQDIEMGPWVENVMENDKHYITLYTFIRTFSGSLENREPHKCESWEWFPLDNLPTPLFSPLKHLLNRL